MRAYRTDFIKRFGRSRSDYAYCYGLTKSEWAWEFLRRNPLYQQDIKTHRIRFPKPLQYRQGAHIYALCGDHLSASKWGLSAFADPDQNADRTHIFWSPDIYKSALIAEPKPPDKQLELDLWNRSNCIALLKSGNCQKLLMRTDNQILDITILNINLLYRDCGLAFRIDNLDHLKKQTEALFLLKHSLIDNQSNAIKRVAKREQTRLIKALIALDCYQEAGSLQDTAHIFRAFGLTRLEWSAHGDESLKKQIIRARKSGLKLMQSDYQKLL